MVRYNVEAGRATVTIDEPDKRNPLSTATMEGLLDRFQRAVADPAVKVVVITGAGDQVFSAGGDLSGGFVDSSVGLHGRRGALADLFRAMWRGGKPTVARVNGHALAGGFGLAMACDLVVTAEDARFGCPEINVGLWPMIITVPLLRAVPPKLVLDLMMTGRLLTASEALAIGAVSRVVPRNRLDETVDQVVAELMSKSPAVLAMGRDAFFAVVDRGFDAALDRLQGGLTEVSLSEDAQEGVAAFVEKRAPVWTGR